MGIDKVLGVDDYEKYEELKEKAYDIATLLEETENPEEEINEQVSTMLAQISSVSTDNDMLTLKKIVKEMYDFDISIYLE